MFTFTPLSAQQAQAISAWRYEPPYDFYNSSAAADEDLRQILDHDNRLYAVSDERDDLIGFFCFGRSAQVLAGTRVGAYDDVAALDVGLGLHPAHTGRGLGLAFIQAGLEFARGMFAPAAFRLTVATFNQRAMTVYERAGFRPGLRFSTDNGQEFLVMARPAMYSRDPE